jgi:NAD(P)-dependent dehydrogenase (short-subunit alcohol dehydrogenase family)
MAKVALPFLRRGRPSVVINITSRWGSIARTASGEGGGIYSYQIAKAAQNMLTVCLDQELAQDGIRVFAVHPGRLKTAVAAKDADVEPHTAALRLADWVASVDRSTACGCHDLMSGQCVAW